MYRPFPPGYEELSMFNISLLHSHVPQDTPSNRCTINCFYTRFFLYMPVYSRQMVKHQHKTNGFRLSYAFFNCFCRRSFIFYVRVVLFFTEFSYTRIIRIVIIARDVSRGRCPWPVRRGSCSDNVSSSSS